MRRPFCLSSVLPSWLAGAVPNERADRIVERIRLKGFIVAVLVFGWGVEVLAQQQQTGLRPSTSEMPVAEKGRRPVARHSIVVWQVDNGGRWEVYVRDLNKPAVPPVGLSGSQDSQENPSTDGENAVWQARQTDGNWDVYMSRGLWGLPSWGAELVTGMPATDEVNPGIDWPWVVYQQRPVGSPSAPWQVAARNLLTGEKMTVAPSSQNQLDPRVQAGRVVWQDFRDSGEGEIYLKDLEEGSVRRLTTNSFGQSHPAVFGQRVVWQDNRHGQAELYGFDFFRDSEWRITQTPESEANPSMDGPWAVCEEDSAGPEAANIRLIHLPSGRVLSLTQSGSRKTGAWLASGAVVWEEEVSGGGQIRTTVLPALQAVFENANAVVITEEMAAQYSNAFTLLQAWHRDAGAGFLAHYRTLVPELTVETARIENGVVTGTDFDLTPGSFLWVKFSKSGVLDLGTRAAGRVDLAAGINVLSFTAFPSDYTAYRLFQQLGFTRLQAVRMLDAESGRWSVTQQNYGRLAGPDFRIPHAAVLLLELESAVAQWKPE